MSKTDLGVPENAVLSASSNMWKSFFGDTSTLMEGIAALIRRFPHYHHIFIGTERCRDSLDFFLNRNPDIASNVRYIGR